MQRRDPKSFLEEVLAQVQLPPDTKEQLLSLVSDKPGAKRATKIAAVLAGKAPSKKKSDDEDDDA